MQCQFGSISSEDPPGSNFPRAVQKSGRVEIHNIGTDTDQNEKRQDYRDVDVDGSAETHVRRELLILRWVKMDIRQWLQRELKAFGVSISDRIPG